MPRKATKKVEAKPEKAKAVKKTKVSAKKPAELKVKEKKSVKPVIKKEKVVAKVEKINEPVEKPVKIEKKAVAAPKAKKTAKVPGADTGSVDFQVSNFTAKITSLAKHLKIHPHDFDSRRGLLIMVGKRRRLLNYVKKSDMEKYEKLSKSLKLKV